MEYRREIDGLRALAVLPVILFHAGFETFSGGFVGVDVFFVISGYLITSIILSELEKGKFSIANFYERRARRILPALLAVLISVYVISWVIFLPSMHKTVGQYVVASILSASNILLYLQGSNYFGLEHSNNPLFHTWSLGVEEQFYLVIPLLLIVLWRLNRKINLSLVVSILVASFALNLVNLDNPTFNFYMVVSRAWELGFGMLAAVIQRKTHVNKNSALALLGFFLISASFFLMPQDHKFSSVLLIFPVVGSFLVILFSSESVFIGRLLAQNIVVAIGLLSYSLYLWHVPLYVFMTYLWGNSAETLTAYFPALFLVSYFSYRFVEKPFRIRRPSSSPFIPVTATVVLVMSVLGVAGHANGGFPTRSKLMENLQVNNGWGLGCNGNTELVDQCSSSENPDVAVLGNSYSMVYVKPLAEIYDQNILQLTQDSCAIGYIDQVRDVNSLPCEQFYRRAVDTIARTESIKTVILSSPFTGEIANQQFEESFLALLEDLGDKKLIVIGPTPSAPFSVGECIFKKSFLASNGSCDFEVSAQHKLNIFELGSLVERYPGAKLIDITDFICPHNLCAMSLNEEEATYIDQGHLSYSGSSRVLSYMSDALDLELE